MTDESIRVKQLHHFQLIKIEGDGNCLFDSIRIACIDIIESQMNNPDINNKEGMRGFLSLMKNRELAVKYFRSVTAEYITEETFKLIKLVQESESNGRDALGVRGDYAFAKKAQTLEELKDIIKNSTSYWGDDIALEAIEKVLGTVRFCVFGMAPNSQSMNLVFLKRPRAKFDNQIPIFVVFLRLINKHYDLVLFKNRVANSTKDIMAEFGNEETIEFLNVDLE